MLLKILLTNLSKQQKKFLRIFEIYFYNFHDSFGVCPLHICVLNWRDKNRKNGKQLLDWFNNHFKGNSGEGSYISRAQFVEYLKDDEVSDLSLLQNKTNSENRHLAYSWYSRKKNHKKTTKSVIFSLLFQRHYQTNRFKYKQAVLYIPTNFNLGKL